VKTGSANNKICQNREKNSKTDLSNEAGKRERSFYFLVKKRSEKYQFTGRNGRGGRRFKMQPSFLRCSLIFKVKWMLKLKHPKITCK